MWLFSDQMLFLIKLNLVADDKSILFHKSKSNKLPKLLVELQ